MLVRQLQARADPVRVGVVGAGMFGSQVVYAAAGTPGLRVAAIGVVGRSRPACSGLALFVTSF
jgi:predicted homoserine dehydrogenase-like protein